MAERRERTLTIWSLSRRRLHLSMVAPGRKRCQPRAPRDLVSSDFQSSTPGDHLSPALCGARSLLCEVCSSTPFTPWRPHLHPLPQRSTSLWTHGSTSRATVAASASVALYQPRHAPSQAGAWPLKDVLAPSEASWHLSITVPW
jgi:hypothetical protein